MKMDEVSKDSRFSHVLKDPRFKKIPKKQVKVKIDKRFQSMFNEKKFQIKYNVDKRGRKVKLGGSEDLRRYYDLSESDDEKDDDDDVNDNEGYIIDDDTAGKTPGSDDEKDDDDVNDNEGYIIDDDIAGKTPGSDDEKDDDDNDNEGFIVDDDKEGKTPESDDEKDDDDDNDNEGFIIDDGKQRKTWEEESDASEKVEEKQKKDVMKVSKKDRKTLAADVKKKLKDLTVDYARGEGAIFSDSSSDEESSDSDDEDTLELEHDWGELDKDAERTDEATKRLAVCNMNWDRIEAADLMVLFNSFLPPGGLIHSVTIYPSEFGLLRMKEEEEKGPIELTQNLPEGEDEKISQIQMEKLRTYQLNRLKYYYAVVVCDTPETADVLYKECDGLEYESSSSKLDLRFIPDDTTFDQEPKETCTSLPNLSTYKPKLFMTSALTKSKCDLTWDENDPNREEIVKSIHSGNVDDSHLKKYLACSSSSESENEEDEVEEKPDTCGLGKLDKYKVLLAEIENKEKNSKKNEVDLEVSWNLKLENKANEIVKEATKEKDKKTPFQQYLEKRKEKKKKKREERRAQMEEENRGSDDSAFSDDDIPSDIDMNDPYFREEFDKSKSKKSSKTKRKEEEVEDEESKQKKAELELLLLDNEPENLKHFSLKEIEEGEKTLKKKMKGKKRKAEETNNFQDDFKIDVNDERFSALYSSHHFNIDPADPQFKATKATKELIQEKLRRREADEAKESSKVKVNEKQVQKSVNKPKNPELSMLVKNIKKNTSGVSKKPRRF